MTSSWHHENPRRTIFMTKTKQNKAHPNFVDILWDILYKADSGKCDSLCNTVRLCYHKFIITCCMYIALQQQIEGSAMELHLSCSNSSKCGYLDHTLSPQKPSHIQPLWANYGVPIVSILDKIHSFFHSFYPIIIDPSNALPTTVLLCDLEWRPCGSNACFPLVWSHMRIFRFQKVEKYAHVLVWLSCVVLWCNTC